MAPVVAIASWSNAQPALMKTGIDLEEKLAPAASLRLYLIATLMAVAFIYSLALFVGGKVTVPERVTELTGTAVLAVLTALLITAAVLFFSTNPSLKDWVGQQYEEFSSKPSNASGADRLLTTNSRVRYQIWREALISFEEKPIIGSGAQSFSIVHMMKKEEWVTFLKDQHSLYIRWLSDLGLIGFSLGLAFVASALTGTIILLRKIKDRWERGQVASFLALSIIYLVELLRLGLEHRCGYDAVISFHGRHFRMVFFKPPYQYRKPKTRQLRIAPTTSKRPKQGF